MYLIPYLSRTLRNPNRLTLPYPQNTLPIHCPNYSVPYSCTTLIIDYATQITFYRVQQSNKLYRLIRHPMHTPLMHYPIPTHSTTLFYALVSHQIKSYREANKTLAFIRSIILLIFMHKKCNIVPPTPFPTKSYIIM